MVIAAYLAGLLTTPAALVGVWLGSRYWRAYRRAQGISEAPVFPASPPPPAPPQGSPRISNMRFSSVPGSRRRVRGRR